MNKSIKGPVILLLCAIFWGSGFAAQSSAMEHIEPYTFVFLRSVITYLFLLVAAPLLNRLSGEEAPSKRNAKRHLFVGVICGCALVTATILQQIGLVTTTTAKSGFITALYIIIVPILGMLFKKKPSPTVWLGVLVSLIGLYFLCMKGTLSINGGDLLTFVAAFIFAVHIILVDKLGASLNSIKLNAIQFATSAVVAGVIAFLLETPEMSGILACWKDVVYVAVISGGLGFSFQIIGQKDTDPTLASLIMCLESVFAAIGGWILLNQSLAGRELLGCVLMLSASVIALLPAKGIKKIKTEK